MVAESPLKMMEKAFYSTLKAVLNSCLYFLFTQKNGLIKKIRLVSKFMTPQPGKQKLQYTWYYLISQEIKAFGQWNLAG